MASGVAGDQYASEVNFEDELRSEMDKDRIVLSEKLLVVRPTGESAVMIVHLANGM